jgi:hypothetical protein
MLIKQAIVAFALAAFAAPAPAAADAMQRFLDDHKERSSVWNVECFQGGRKIFAAAKLRIGRYKGPHGVSNQFADQQGREVRIFTAPGTACLVRQLAGRRVMAAAPGKGGLELRKSKRN